MLNAINVNTEAGEKTFYLFVIQSMTACERNGKVKADFTAQLEYVRESETETPETPKKLMGITELENGDLLQVYVLEKVEEAIKDAFCNKKHILAWVERSQGADTRTIEGVISLPSPIEAEHVDYYKQSFERACQTRRTH